MAVLSKEDLLASFRERLGEDASDEALALVEDITDTLNDYESRTSDSTDWRTRYEENDAMWRKKYRDRFFDSDGSPNLPPEPDKPKTYSYDSLFTEKE